MSIGAPATSRACFGRRLCVPTPDPRLLRGHGPWQQEPGLAIAAASAAALRGRDRLLLLPSVLPPTPHQRGHVLADVGRTDTRHPRTVGTRFHYVHRPLEAGKPLRGPQPVCDRRLERPREEGLRVSALTAANGLAGIRSTEQRQRRTMGCKSRGVLDAGWAVTHHSGSCRVSGNPAYSRRRPLIS